MPRHNIGTRITPTLIKSLVVNNNKISLANTDKPKKNGNNNNNTILSVFDKVFTASSFLLLLNLVDTSTPNAFEIAPIKKRPNAAKEKLAENTPVCDIFFIDDIINLFEELTNQNPSEAGKTGRANMIYSLIFSFSNFLKPNFFSINI